MFDCVLPIANLSSCGRGRPGVLLQVVFALPIVLILMVGAPLGSSAADDSLLTGVAGTQTAAVICGEGTLYFSDEIQQNWTDAQGTDAGLLYTDVIAVTGTGFLVTAEDGSIWASSTALGQNFLYRDQASSLPLRALSQIRSWVVAVGDGGTITRSSGTTGAGWTEVDDVPVETNLHGIISNGVTSVAVGEGGTILKGGGEATNWFRVNIGTTANFYDVVADPNGNYLAVGQDGEMWRSGGDGTSWSRVNAGIDATLNSAAMVGLRAIVVGDNGTVYYSNGGFDGWQPANTPAGLTADLRAVTYTTSNVLAAGEHNTAIWSFDGSTWIFVPTSTIETTWGRVKQSFLEGTLK